MPALTQREQLTIRFAAIGIALYLALFFGASGWNRMEAKRHDYARLLAQAQTAALDRERHQNKLLLLDKLKHGSSVDLSKLSRAMLEGQASEAIQRAAQASGAKIGPIRETPGSSSGKELASMQLEATGPIAGVMALLHRLDVLEFPLVVDSLQIDPDPKKPGTVKLVIQLVLLDYEQWKPEARPNV
jgi:hypothetical protein